jgi:hypothetical protein
VGSVGRPRRRGAWPARRAGGRTASDGVGTTARPARPEAAASASSTSERTTGSAAAHGDAPHATMTAARVAASWGTARVTVGMLRRGAQLTSAVTAYATAKVAAKTSTHASANHALGRRDRAGAASCDEAATVSGVW